MSLTSDLVDQVTLEAPTTCEQLCERVRVETGASKSGLEDSRTRGSRERTGQFEVEMGD